jgi:hypothetical protein
MEYQPARPIPTWTSHGHTCHGAAPIVIARVASNVGESTRSSPGSTREASAAVAPQRSCHGRYVLR